MARAVISGRARWVSLALIAINVVVYISVRHHEFVAWDDPQYISENPQVSGGLTWHGVAWAFTTGHYANWHPLTWLSHMLDVQLYGMNAGAHHLTNVLFHIANTLLLFGLLHRMTGALGRSAFVAGLFAVHPLHVESVAWVAERKDVLSTLFWMLTFWAYVGYVRQPRRGRYLVVVLLFGLGLMAKPMLVTLPFVLLLLDVWPLGRVSLGGDSPGRSGGVPPRHQRAAVLQLVREKLPLLALSVASSIVTFVVQLRGEAVAELDAFPLDLRVANALASYVAYISNMLWPFQLAAFYPYPPSLPALWVIGSIVILTGVSVAVIWAARRCPYLLVGWFLYLGTLVPVIGLVQVGFQAMADRYTYIPLIGLFVVVGWGIPDLLARWRYRSFALPAAAGGLILACMITARDQVQSWKNTIALWEHTLQVTTENYTAQSNLGDALVRQGRVEEAIAHLSEALRIKPNSAEAHSNLGAVLAKEGRFDEAIAHLSEALRIQPDYAEAHNNLGGALASQGRFDEATHEMLEALQIKPDQANWHQSLAFMLHRRGNTREAVHHFETALKLNPRLQGARRALDELRNRSKRAGPGAVGERNLP